MVCCKQLGLTQKCDSVRVSLSSDLPCSGLGASFLKSICCVPVYITSFLIIIQLNPLITILVFNSVFTTMINC